MQFPFQKLLQKINSLQELTPATLCLTNIKKYARIFRKRIVLKHCSNHGKNMKKTLIHNNFKLASPDQLLYLILITISIIG